MKFKMWAVYHTKHSKRPRSIHFAKWEAEHAARPDWLVKRVEVTYKNGTSYDVCYHEYKHIKGMNKEEYDYYESLPDKN